MPINNAFDAFELFKKHGAAFEASATFTEFYKAAGLEYLDRYDGGGWMSEAFETAKAGKTSVYRPLKFPRAAQFPDLFTAAYFLPCGGTRDKKDPAPPVDACFMSGSNGGAPCGHVGGRRGWSDRTPDTRSHYGAKFYGTYVKPRPEVAALVKTQIGAYGGYSYEAIKRDDGILILAQCSQIIGSVWLALLDVDADVSTMFDDETRAFIAKEKQAEIDAWGAAE